MSLFADDQVAALESGFRLTGWKVLAILLAFFGTIGLVNAYMVHVALSTFSGETTAHAYEAGIAYNTEIAAARAQRDLHWSIVEHVERVDATRAQVRIIANDAAGTPLSNLQFVARFQAPSDEKLDHEVALTQDAPGSFVGVLPLAASHWDLVVSAVRDGKRVFQSKNRILFR